MNRKEKKKGNLRKGQIVANIDEQKNKNESFKKKKENMKERRKVKPNQGMRITRQL